MSVVNRITTGVFSTWANFFITAATSLVLAPFLVHRLGNDGYGLWSLYMAFTGYFTLIDFGVSPAIVRYASKYAAIEDGEAEHRILATGLVFFALASVVVMAIVAGATLGYASLFPEPGVPLPIARATFLLVGLDFALNLPFSVFQGVLLGHQRYLALQGINIVVRLLRFGLVLALMSEGPGGLVLLAAVFLSTSLLRDAGLYRAATRSLGAPIRLKNFRKAAVRDLLDYSVPAFVISISIRLMAYTDSMVIGYAIGVGAITYYALAASLVDYVQEIGWGLAGVLVPVVSGHEALDQVGPIRKRYLQFTRYCVFLMTPIVAISFVLGRSFFIRWVGPDYALSADILAILVSGMAVFVILMPAQAVLKGMSRHRYLARLLVVEAVLNLVLSLYLARDYGVVGVALGTLIPRLAVSGVVLPVIMLRLLDIPFLGFLRAGFLPALPGAGTLLLLAWLTQPLVARDLGWGGMVLVGACFAGAFGLVTLALGTSRVERRWLTARVLRAGRALRRAAGSPPPR